MKSKFLVTAVGCALATAALLAACGGGSSGSTSSGATPTVAASTTSGVLTAFGSVVVNGIEYATGSSTSVVDGDADDNASSVSALQVGMTVDVNASGQTAQLLRYTSAVRGEVDAVDTGNSTLTVLGQTVQVSGGTSFSGSKRSGAGSTAITQLSDISAGDYVVVYGLIDCTASGTGACASGSNTAGTQVLASLIAEPGSAGSYRVEGYAQNSASGSFTINGLTVDMSTAAAATACTPSPCAITNGQFVAVRGSAAPANVNGALTLAATRIKTESLAPVLTAGATVSLEGPVEQLDTTTSSFTVRGIPIDGSALAATVATLSDGEVAEVSGTVSSVGTIVATAIVAEARPTFALTAPLTAESATASTLTVLGQTFTVNSATRFIDRISGVRPFNAGNFATVLKPGDQLIVSGATTSSGTVATRVERIPAPGSAIVGVVGIVTADSASADTVTIGGVTATLGSGTTLEYPGGGTSPTLAGFFSAITVQSSLAAIVGTAGAGAGTITAGTAAAMPSTNQWASAPH